MKLFTIVVDAGQITPGDDVDDEYTIDIDLAVNGDATTREVVGALIEGFADRLAQRGLAGAELDVSR